MTITDIHSHSLRKNAIVCATPSTQFSDGYLYSFGIHPWNTDRPLISTAEKTLIDIITQHKQIVAIGETGIDNLRGAPVEIQQRIMEIHINVSEYLCMPMIIHSVHAHHIIAAMHKRHKPRQTWIIHGFRGNAETARMLTDRGICLSLGEKFNHDSAAMIPHDMLMLETDESILNIEDIAACIADYIPETTAEKLLKLSSENIKKAGIHNFEI